MIQEKIGEALGLEKAAQKAVVQLDSRGLLKSEHMNKVIKNERGGRYPRAGDGRTSPSVSR